MLKCNVPLARYLLAQILRQHDQLRVLILNCLDFSEQLVLLFVLILVPGRHVRELTH